MGLEWVVILGYDFGAGGTPMGVTPGRRCWGLCLDDGEPSDIEPGTE